MDPLTVAEALDEYGREAGAGPARAVRRFLEAEGFERDASQALTRHLRDLEAQGMKPGTRDYHYRMVRAFYRRLRDDPRLAPGFRLSLRVPRVKDHRYSPDDADVFALSTEAVAQLVRAACDGQMRPLYAAYVALATTYGPRAIELSRVKAEDIDREGERFYRRVAKGGVSRWMWMPPAIALYLLDVWPRVATKKVEDAFAHAWDAAIEEERPKGVAWHSVRHALHRDLTAAGVPEEERTRFGCWAPSRTMAARYARPNRTVGTSGVEVARPEEEGTREYDGNAWDVHPYLPLWS